MNVAKDQRVAFSTVFDHLEKVEVFASVLAAGLFALLVLFALSAGVASSTLADGIVVALRAFSVGVAIVFAAGATGALLGFLFGIPRLLQRPGPSQPQTADLPNGASQSSQRQMAGERFFSTNTSFEEISDWLTKIIIGLGLTQFQMVLTYLYTASLYAASYISLSPVPAAAANPSDGKIATVVAFCLIVTSLFSACLIAYLETRTRLAALFTRAEVAASQEALLDSISRPISDREVADQSQRAGSRPEPVTTPATTADRELLTVPLSGLRSSLAMAAWGSAQARSGNFDKALEGLNEAITTDPGNSGTRLRLAQVLRLKGDVPAYLEAVLKAAELDPTNVEIAHEARSAQLDALYLNPPASFQYAIRLGNYLAKSPLADDPKIWMYTAAARGQEYKHKIKTAPPQELTEIRKEALDAIAQVVTRAPDPESSIRKTLRATYLPGSGVDDDLHVFYQDKDFDDLLGVSAQEAPADGAQNP
ncbi:hypothetical protein [Rhizobium sp. L43]|uniref:tetratricopeptide repeat protein n=1 Tax=Rhizobium sp. L43 TaxID=2035452 RepID=UPI000BEA7D1E|nr:hypothetical protein [Rhizobium sp. L43]PDS77117.1 hypothetical protein CO667_18145 [Rhizobium sp. L43]